MAAAGALAGGQIRRNGNGWYGTGNFTSSERTLGTSCRKEDARTRVSVRAVTGQKLFGFGCFDQAETW